MQQRFQCSLNFQQQNKIKLVPAVRMYENVMLKMIPSILVVVILVSAASAQAPTSIFPECGVPNPSFHDIRGLLPWSAAVFVKTGPSKPFRFLASAAIIGHSSVVTIFEGAYGAALRSQESKFTLPNPATLYVIAGINSTDPKSTDSFKQVRKVKWISPYSDTTATNQLFYPVILHLQKPLKPTGNASFPQPLCVAEPHIEINTFNNHRYASGFSSLSTLQTSYRLNFSVMTPLPQDQCDKIYRVYFRSINANALPCAKQIIADPICVSTGFFTMVQHEGREHLGGMVSVVTARGSNACASGASQSTATYFYQDFTTMAVSRWLQNNVKCGPNRFACAATGECIPLEQVCNGKEDCPDGSGYDEDTILCEATNYCTADEFTCNFLGGCFPHSSLCDGIAQCPHEVDEDPEFCVVQQVANTIRNNIITRLTQLKDEETALSSDLAVASVLEEIEFEEEGSKTPCPLLQYGLGVKTTCFRGRRIIPCNNATEGAVLRLTCADFYITKYRSNFADMKCSRDGAWKPFKPFACEPDCGLIGENKTQTAYVAGGLAVDSEYRFPWFAAIFLKSESTAQYRFICGGSLIEPSVVITAGHCVYGLDIEEMMVVLGGTSSDFEESSTQNSSIVLSVTQQQVPRTYDEDSLRSDLALLKLNDSVVYNSQVRPVCYLNSDRKQALSTDVFGKVAGYGKDGYGSPLPKLSWTDVPVLPHEKCQQLFEYNQLSGFCGGFGNGSAVCQGDSGGGFVVQELHNSLGQRYIIKGIVSKGYVHKNGTCNTGTPGVFTYVEAFDDWIYGVLEVLEDA